ncbi:hypothetical protein HAHE_14850 [Haloferula helveola]|uniref:DUF3108 domain-containing protein n=1 Tax=Haloferula helveola TaxID=490095 RepID=A0ABM7RIY2_9BACT|nr:hypothetical protein HAHE_14850 [Haloferula helveola]
MRDVKAILTLLAAAFLTSCSTLTVPGQGDTVAGPDRAAALLERSAKATGDAWSRYRKVTVCFDGEWGSIVKRLQPELVDDRFRKTSVETYDTRRGTVVQQHRGPDGAKTVERSRSDVVVTYNGERIGDEPRRDASALVADAYTAFLLGTSWLKEKGEDLSVIGTDTIDGEVCDGVQGTLRPGLGFSEEDRFIAWIGRDSGLMRRFQFTIEGLASTRGADVDVTFSEFWKAADGSVWPGRFLEWVHRPVFVMAHEWTMTGLEVDGRKLR